MGMFASSNKEMNERTTESRGLKILIPNKAQWTDNEGVVWWTDDGHAMGGINIDRHHGHPFRTAEGRDRGVV